MLIYCYADILGYRNLVRNKSASEIHSLLNEAFSQMYTVLDAYTESGRIKEVYKEGIHFEDDYRALWDFFNEKTRKDLNDYYKRIDEKVLHLNIKTYLAFDTIVIYWEDYQYTPYHTELFTLAVSVVYLLLYMKGILIRGAMGVSNDYYIGEGDRFFIVNNIDVANELENMQNWGNILVFGENLLGQYDYSGMGPLTDDFYARTLLPAAGKTNKHFEFVPFKKIDGSNYINHVLEGKTAAKIEDISIHSSLVTICPINNFCLSFFGVNFFQELYNKSRDTIKEEVAKSLQDHPAILRYLTARYLFNRMESCVSNNNILAKSKRFYNGHSNQLWDQIVLDPDCSALLRSRWEIDRQYSIHIAATDNKKL